MQQNDRNGKILQGAKSDNNNRNNLPQDLPINRASSEKQKSKKDYSEEPLPNKTPSEESKSSQIK